MSIDGSGNNHLKEFRKRLDNYDATISNLLLELGITKDTIEKKCKRFQNRIVCPIKQGHLIPEASFGRHFKSCTAKYLDVPLQTTQVRRRRKKTKESIKEKKTIEKFS